MLAKRVWPMIASTALASIFGYFIYHTIQGERGWVAQMNLQNQVNIAQDRLNHLQQERHALEHRVQLMRPGTMDPDLLDEESRKSLNYSKPNEIILLTPPNSPRS